VFHLPQKDMRLDINDINMFDFLINSERSHDDEPGEEVDTFSSEQPTEETGIERIYKVNWHQDEEDPTLFMPVVNTELYWTWSKADRKTHKSCNFKGSVRVVKLSKVGLHGGCQSEITFRCGTLKMTVEKEALRLACREHNLIVTSSYLAKQRSNACMEGRCQQTLRSSPRLQIPTSSKVTVVEDIHELHSTRPEESHNEPGDHTKVSSSGLEDLKTANNTDADLQGTDQRGGGAQDTQHMEPRDMEPREKSAPTSDKEMAVVESITSVHDMHKIHPSEYIPPRFLNHDRIYLGLDQLDDARNVQ
jgi:hypothetical protein